MLEVLAGREDVSPAAARRAQALLGSVGRLDGVDRALADSVHRRAEGSRLTVVGATRTSFGEWRPGIGIDDTRQRVWLSDGRTIDAQRTPLLLRILVAIADAGGVATKEMLITSAWGEREYHKLRHDNRLQVAIHELRERIEERPDDPTRLVTTSEGYGFGPDEPVRWLR